MRLNSAAFHTTHILKKKHLSWDHAEAIWTQLFFTLWNLKSVSQTLMYDVISVLVTFLKNHSHLWEVGNNQILIGTAKFCWDTHISEQEKQSFEHLEEVTTRIDWKFSHRKM